MRVLIKILITTIQMSNLNSSNWKKSISRQHSSTSSLNSSQQKSQLSNVKYTPIKIQPDPVKIQKQKKRNQFYQAYLSVQSNHSNANHQLNSNQKNSPSSKKSLKISAFSPKTQDFQQSHHKPKIDFDQFIKSRKSQAKKTKNTTLQQVILEFKQFKIDVIIQLKHQQELLLKAIEEISSYVERKIEELFLEKQEHPNQSIKHVYGIDVQFINGKSKHRSTPTEAFKSVECKNNTSNAFQKFGVNSVSNQQKNEIKNKFKRFNTALSQIKIQEDEPININLKNTNSVKQGHNLTEVKSTPKSIISKLDQYAKTQRIIKKQPFFHS